MSRPGSTGEHQLQDMLGTTERAQAFYDKQVLGYLNEPMRAFIARMEMVFVSTSDAHGECDCSFRAGEPGFVRVLDPRTVALPEYRGNGVMASMGNVTENPHIGRLFVDFFESRVGLHVNGRASLRPAGEMSALPSFADPRARHWVVVEVEEAFIHCSKHIPLLQKREAAIHWGTDDPAHKGGDYFRAKHEPRPEAPREAAPAAPALLVRPGLDGGAE